MSLPSKTVGASAGPWEKIQPGPSGLFPERPAGGGGSGEDLDGRERLEEADKGNNANHLLHLITFLRRQRGRKGRREGKERMETERGRGMSERAETKGRG